jgi:DNA-binding NtrC family response regulator
MNPKSILVIDNDSSPESCLGRALNRNGYMFDTAQSGPEALAKFKGGDYGLVLSEMTLPRMSGLEILGGVKKLRPEVPVVMMTSAGTISGAVEAIRAGACDYLIKPVEPDVLDETIKKAVKTNGGKGTEANRGGKEIITVDPVMKELLGTAECVAESDAPVLILGESGTGKELLASYIHNRSRRSSSAYVAVNCAALPENLAESELFGHEKGAFTGAGSRKSGKFEMADRGTLVLDEISEMPLCLQAKLLRALQEGEIDRVGGGKPVPVDTRVIAVSNKDLRLAVEKGEFRGDLYYRINMIPLRIPPLRERKRDLEKLARYFHEKYSERFQKPGTKLAGEIFDMLASHSWPGNVRELENTIARAVLMCRGTVIGAEHLAIEGVSEEAGKPAGEVTVGMSVREMEKKLILETLRTVDGNRTHAAKILDISIRTLRNKLKEYREGCEFVDAV